ncbi:MAG: L-glutamate gamma-semialdehyde dehydrogenase, partial [Candidatus Thermoplasmatota archaeon]
MAFRNERTWQDAVEGGRTEEFHASYDAAVRKVKAEFGQKHPHYIDGKPRWSKGGAFRDISPTDRALNLGLFQKGTRADAR